MGLFNILKKNKKARDKSYIKSLLDVANIDGKLDENELSQIVKIAKKFNITLEEVNEIRDNLDEIKFIPPSGYSAKVKLLEDLVKIMMSDKSIDESEIKFCKDFAYKLNIAPQMVDDLIQTLNS